MAAPIARSTIPRARSSLTPRSSLPLASLLRPYSTGPPPAPLGPSKGPKNPLKMLSSEPYKTPLSPIYPPPKDPFQPTSSLPDPEQSKHSPAKIAVVKAVARLMGYNSKTSTAIRETGRICGEIVDAVGRDKEFWYGDCALPPTYQTFFQLHLLHLLILLPRLRALPSQSLSSTYQAELLTHFFSLAETQMRITLGQGERERVVRGYMTQMGEQWKGAGVAFDYALARSGEVPRGEKEGELVVQQQGEVLGEGSDTEMASWVWRNLFAARSAPLLPSAPAPSTEGKTVTPPVDDLALAINLEKIVRFIRREMYRLERVEDEAVIKGEVGSFGRINDGNVTSEGLVGEAQETL